MVATLNRYFQVFKAIPITLQTFKIIEKLENESYACKQSYIEIYTFNNLGLNLICVLNFSWERGQGGGKMGPENLRFQVNTNSLNFQSYYLDVV